jgi:signal transduction histidine kinase
MSRVRDRLAPVVAGGLVLVVALTVVLLLRLAGERGTSALADAKVAQVQATANSFNARVSAQLTAAAGLGASPWELRRGSAADAAALKAFDINPDAESGFFLLNAADRVTAGVLLRPGALGSRYAPPGWADVKKRLAAEPAVIMPVGTGGLTTELPSFAYVVGIRGADGKLRGALVAEQAVTAASTFQKEISELGAPDAETEAWFFVDAAGTVVASSSGTGLGRPVEDRRYVNVPPGRADLDHRIVAAADIPTLGWRVVFRQDRAEFEAAVSGPLARAGTILVVFLFGVGLTLVVLLVRRLRDSREQARRLAELNRSQAEFISVVSHELRTPVAGVLGFLQTTVDHWEGMSDADRLATVRRAVTNARRLQAMTRDVLDIDAIETGRLGYVFRRVDLAAELRAAVDLAEVDGPDHPVRLLPPPHVTVSADPDRLQQVFANLLANARRNAPGGEPITVETELAGTPDDPRVRIAVVDRGPGVDASMLERIFEKFVRGGDDAVTGTGLGLYIVRRIVDAHHGRIWCESSPGDRTAFVVELPVSAEYVPDRHPDDASPAAGRDGAEPETADPGGTAPGGTEPGGVPGGTDLIPPARSGNTAVPRP